MPISREAYIKNYLILTESDFFPAPLFISLSDTRFTEAGQESLFLKRRANRVSGVVNKKNFKKKKNLVSFSIRQAQKLFELR